MAHCVHHVPGRVRFKVPQLRYDPTFAAEFEKTVVALDGILHVEVNRHASSVIVHYDSKAKPFDAIVEHIHASAPAAEATPGSLAVVPIHRDAANGHAANGSVARTVGQIFGQAMFATLVQRTLERSLLSVLTGVP